jgi:ligand-binding SRPBCC domain-containing protein
MKFVKESILRATPEQVFTFHELADALERLTPPWEQVRVVQRANISQVGSRAIIETRLFGLIPARWVAEHTVYDPPRLFVDVQISGPFRAWQHRHIIEPHPQGAVLRDEIEYEPPLWWLGRWAAPFAIEPRLRRMFDFRHKITRAWCEEKG